MIISPLLYVTCGGVVRVCSVWVVRADLDVRASSEFREESSNYELLNVALGIDRDQLVEERFGTHEGQYIISNRRQRGCDLAGLCKPLSEVISDPPPLIRVGPGDCCEKVAEPRVALQLECPDVALPTEILPEGDDVAMQCQVPPC